MMTDSPTTPRKTTTKQEECPPKAPKAPKASRKRKRKRMDSGNRGYIRKLEY